MNPFGTIKNAALDTVKHPLGTTQKAVGQTVGLARGTAEGVVHAAAGLLPGGSRSSAPDPAASEPLAEPAEERKVHGDPVVPKKASARSAPATTAEVAAGEDSEVTTPVGTTGADVATNPDTTETDLQQPGTEPLMDPSTVKAVASETETLTKGADTDKG